MSKPAIVVFTKNARPGSVKTRLAAHMGSEASCALYQHLLEHTRQLLEGLQMPRFVYYDEYINDRDKWDNCCFIKNRQQGPDLRTRMQAATDQIFARGIAPILILGADCPELTEAHIAEALDHLRQGHYVLGQTHAGGFYMLGLPQASVWIFQADWAKGQRGAGLQTAMQAQGVHTYHMPTLHDLSCPGDLALLASHPLVAPFLQQKGSAA